MEAKTIGNYLLGHSQIIAVQLVAGALYFYSSENNTEKYEFC